MKTSILTVVLTVLFLVSACASTAPVKSDIDDLLKMEIVAPPPTKPVEEREPLKKLEPKRKPTLENATEIAAISAGPEKKKVEPVCSKDDLHPLTTPVQLEVVSFELSDENEGTEKADGATLLRNCCEIRKSLVENDSRFPSQCRRAQVAKKNP